MESRWEVRFQHVEGELEELASRNARVLRTVLDMRRDQVRASHSAMGSLSQVKQSSTIARTSQLETNVGDVCNRVAELSRSVGTLLAEMKGSPLAAILTVSFLIRCLRSPASGEGATQRQVGLTQARTR